MKKIKQTGKLRLDFIVKKEFQKKFKLEKSSYTFQSHLELDEFVMRLLEIDDSFDFNYPEHWELLKGFDRAFWMRHKKCESEKKELEEKAMKYTLLMDDLKKEDQERVQERIDEITEAIQEIEFTQSKINPYSIPDPNNEKACIEKCPFDNPTKTKSFWVPQKGVNI
jgi:hypothetical protein